MPEPMQLLNPFATYDSDWRNPYDPTWQQAASWLPFPTDKRQDFYNNFRSEQEQLQQRSWDEYGQLLGASLVSQGLMQPHGQNVYYSQLQGSGVPWGPDAQQEFGGDAVGQAFDTPAYWQAVSSGLNATIKNALEGVDLGQFESYHQHPLGQANQWLNQVVTEGMENVPDDPANYWSPYRMDDRATAWSRLQGAGAALPQHIQDLGSYLFNIYGEHGAAAAPSFAPMMNTSAYDAYRSGF